MAKKNFDDFVISAGKRNKPSPEEVDELSRILHPINQLSLETPEKVVETPEKTTTSSSILPKKAAEKVPPAAVTKPVLEKSMAKQPTRKIVGKEKVRVTVDLDKDLYRKLKMHVIVAETDLSTYLRELLAENLT